MPISRNCSREKPKPALGFSFAPSDEQHAALFCGLNVPPTFSLLAVRSPSFTAWGHSLPGTFRLGSLAKQAGEIAAVNKTLRGSRVTVLRSIEMNLNPRGEGDMDAKALARLDIVLGAFHSALRTKEDQTPRYLAALRNPKIQILGHPRGRIYNFRMGLKADWPRVFAQAAKLDKAVEIDSYPDRQDLNLAVLQIARKEGVLISLGTDSHHAYQLEFIELGLAAALKARIPPDRILSFTDLASVRAWVAKLRARRR